MERAIYLIIIILIATLAIPAYLTTASAVSPSMFRVEIDDQEYLIRYLITDGTVRYATVNESEKSLLIYIRSSGDGEISVEIPTFVMDASDENGDLPFAVFLHETDGSQNVTDITVVEFSETRPIKEARTLDISFTKDTLVVEIRGTYLVPEFSSIAVVIAASSLSAALIVSRIIIFQSGPRH